MPDAAPKPIIALSGKMIIDADGKKVSSKSVLNMKAMLEKAGADVVIIDPTQDNPKDIKKFSGVVFMGNDNDIDPKKYGETTVHEKTKVETDPESYKDKDGKLNKGNFMLGVARADYEYKAMDVLRELDEPSLNICGGMQRQFVVAGGKLIQHVDGHIQTEAPAVPVQHIDIIPDTKLAHIAGDLTSTWMPAPNGPKYTESEVNNYHHQAVNKDTLPKDFRISATYTKDGIATAIESTREDRFLIGVQWHPEFMPDNPLSQKLVAATVEAARAYEAKRARTQPAPEQNAPVPPPARSVSSMVR